MSIRTNYKHTLAAGYVSFVTQAIVNNFTPLLFVTFQHTWFFSLGKLAFLSTYNFLVQLLIDFLAARYADKIGVRRCMVFAHISAAAGLAGLGVFPFVFSHPYAGILFSITLYAMGGGLIEVLASPIIEACPTVNKEANMSLLHSFYCWGQVIAILFSTCFFWLFDLANWRILTFLWAVVPALNGVYFTRVPISLEKEKDKPLPEASAMFRDKFFYILLIMMLCAGACELAVAQWASAFAEASLGISKTAGDIAGPCFFALLMGIARFSYARFSAKVPLETYILFCAGLCLAGYLMIALSPVAFLSLLGCGVAGFAVGIMWPGTYSIGAKSWQNPSTAMFAFFALAGDCGCSAGPFLVGMVSEKCGSNLKTGLFAGAVFPLVMILATLLLLFYQKKNKATEGK